MKILCPFDSRITCENGRACYKCHKREEIQKPWRRNETTRGKVSAKKCSNCGAKPCITEDNTGFFNIVCARCANTKPNETFAIASKNLYEGIKLWNETNE